jgi:hypothetical protein
LLLLSGYLFSTGTTNTNSSWYHADGINSVFNVALPLVDGPTGLLVFQTPQLRFALTKGTAVRALGEIVVHYQTESEAAINPSELTVLQ